MEVIFKLVLCKNGERGGVYCIFIVLWGLLYGVIDYYVKYDKGLIM